MLEVTSAELCSNTMYKATSGLEEPALNKLVTKERYVIIKCDVFKVLALMFKADPRVHTLSIPEVAKIKGDCIFTLIKGSKFVGEPEKGGDKFARLISDLD